MASAQSRGRDNERKLDQHLRERLTRTADDITSATLKVAQLADGASTASASLYRVLVSWGASSTVTWNSMSTSGPGMQRDNVEASAMADATTTNLTLTGLRTFSGAGLTSSPTCRC